MAASNIDELLSQLRRAAGERGAEWLQEQVGGLLAGSGPASAAVSQAGSSPASSVMAASAPVIAPPAPGVSSRRRARPPERLSPELTPRARARRGSPSRDPPARAARAPARSVAARTGRNPARRTGPAERRGRGPSPRASAAVASEHQNYVEAAGPHGDAPVGGPARHRQRDEESPDRLVPGGGRPDRVRADLGAAVPFGMLPGVPVQGPPGGPAPGEGQSHLRSAVHLIREQRQDSFWAPEVGFERSTGERGLQGSGGAAGGFTAPGQPGEFGSFSSQASPALPAGGPSAGVGPVSGGDPAWQELAGSMREFLARFSGPAGSLGATGSPGPFSPVSAWGVSGGVTHLPQRGVDTGLGAGSLVRSEGVTVSVQTEQDAVDRVRLDDKARGEVYVCFEGPLGAHLKKEVKEKIWQDEYVEIFSLLPLDKFNLPKGKRDEFKKEEEEKRRWRLIPQTFQNWLQAFAILASVIGEKAPDNCSGLFCYMDSIGEAHRVYGGQAWLRYDEQFRQRKAVRPAIRWDQKDIGLWLRVMAPTRFGQPFQGGPGGSGQQGSSGSFGGGSQGVFRAGVCWQFNENQCRFGTGCRFKHVCSVCSAGSHGASRCLRRGKGKGSGGQQGGDTSEGSRDATVSK